MRQKPLMENFEKVAESMTLMSMFEELSPENRRHLIEFAKTMRRTQGGRRTKNDPFGEDPPNG